jgi:hypothetical protein
MFECKNVFIDPPTIRISYLAGALQGLTLQLPVLLHKYMEGAELSAEDFFKRWKQIGGAPREHQSIFGLVNKNRTMDSEFVQKVVKGFKWGIVTGVDPNVKNIVGATVLHSSEGKFGCLLRLEPNFETQVRDSASERKNAKLTRDRCTGLLFVRLTSRFRLSWSRLCKIDFRRVSREWPRMVTSLVFATPRPSLSTTDILYTIAYSDVYKASQGRPLKSRLFCSYINVFVWKLLDC